MRGRLVFVNHPLETFTRGASGALATYIHELCRAAAADGFGPVVVTSSAPQPPMPWPHVVEVGPIVAPRGPARVMARGRRKLGAVRHLEEPSYAARVEKALAGLGAERDILFLQNSPELALRLRRRFPAAKLVHLFQNQIEARGAARTRLGAAVALSAAVSDFTTRWVAGHYGLENVQTILSGVDCKTFAPPAEPPAGLPVISFTGRTGIEKAPDVLLDALVLVAEGGGRFGVQILGSNHWDRFERDPYQDRLDRSVARLVELGIEVRRPGHVDRARLPDELRRAAIHVTPSRWDEPFGLVTLEAMASGLATIGSRTGGTPEVIGEAGLLFERDDVSGLAALVAGLLAQPGRRAALGAAARRRAETLTWTRTWERWRTLLQTV